MKMKLLAAVGAMALGVSNAHAAVISFATPIAVPNNVDGVYVNLLTGGTATSAFTGWDINLYNTNSVLTFFWNNTAPSVSGGVATAVTGGTYVDLPAGSVVSAASIFSASSGGGGAGATAAFQTTGIHTLGFRFYNESTSAVNYGFMRLQTTATSGFPATILGWSFENTGAAITVPGAVTPGVPEPATWAMMMIGFGAMGGALRRRTKVAARIRFA